MSFFNVPLIFLQFFVWLKRSVENKLGKLSENLKVA